MRITESAKVIATIHIDVPSASSLDTMGDNKNTSLVYKMCLTERFDGSSEAG